MESRSSSKLPEDVLDSYIDSKIRCRNFESYKYLFNGDTTNDEYKKMRRSIKPYTPPYTYARKQAAKFYLNYGFYYPGTYRPDDWPYLLSKDVPNNKSYM